MARRRGLDHDDVVATALAIVDRDGLGALSLRAVADALEVQPPSHYSHVDGLTGLLDDCSVAATAEFGEVLRDSVIGVAGEDAIRAFATAYRRWARSHPGRYELSLRPVAGAEKRNVGRSAIATMDTLLAGLGLVGGPATHAGRSLRAALHGFATLEIADALGRGDHDASFDELVALLLDGLRSRAATAI